MNDSTDQESPTTDSLNSFLEMLDPEQRQAIELSTDISKRVVGVTGQAGTGKTTLFEGVFKLLKQAGYRVAACAPTGRAAKRIEEKTGIPAMTIHRMLEYPYPGERDPKTGKAHTPGEPKRDRQNPLDFDIVLGDEWAMVNHEVHRNVINALPTGGCLRCFGDTNQLRPIENSKAMMKKPSPFMDVLDRFPNVVLKTIHRQGEGSDIIVNADRILNGRTPRNLEQFRIRMTNKPQDVIRDLIHTNAENGINFYTPDNQIITPTRKTWVGTWKLNALLQMHAFPNRRRDEMLNLPRKPWENENVTYVGVGDKIIWTENDYNLHLMNGETGVIVEVDLDFGMLTVDFGSRIVEIPPEVMVESLHTERVTVYDPRKSIDLAYAITTHKAQGSEYQNVFYVLNKASRFIQSRSNLYTGITRARNSVDLITDMPSMSNSVSRVLSQMDTR